MVSQGVALFHLQQIDLQVIHHHKRLKEIATALEDNQIVIQAQQTVDTIQDKLSPLKLQVRDLELETQSTVQKHKASEDRLYSGNVKNPKELQDLQQKIASLKKREGELEDDLLELMIAVEETQAEFDDSLANRATITQEWEHQRSDLLNEEKDIQTSLETLKAQRNTATQEVSPENLKTYDTMKTKKSNQPISALENRSCSVCGIEQTLIVQREVRREQTLVTCVNCGRILVNVKG